jgi:hypothetical protein
MDKYIEILAEELHEFWVKFQQSNKPFLPYSKLKKESKNDYIEKAEVILKKMLKK